MLTDVLPSIIPDPEDQEGLKGVDHVLMVSCFFPKADERELSHLILLSIWLTLLSGQVSKILLPQIAPAVDHI